MPTYIKRIGGVAVVGTLVWLAALILPGVSAESNGKVVSAVFKEPQKNRAQSRPASPGFGCPGESVLLLRNGEVLQGRVTRNGDRYTVRVAGGEIILKAHEVQYECRDLAELYQRKAALIQQDGVGDHLELAQWCIRVGLLEHAARELDTVAALDPRHPMLEILRRRFDAASTPLPRIDPKSQPQALGPTAQELDRMVRNMPPRTVEMFVQTIQPMLVNNCATAACHGPSVTNGFRLLRVPPNSPPSRLLTQRNLHAALQWLDRESPDASPLLTYATTAHGAARIPVFTDHRVHQFRQLREWCHRVAQTEASIMQASYDEPVAPRSTDSGVRSHRSARGPRYSSGRSEDDIPSSTRASRFASESSPETVDLRGDPGRDLRRLPMSRDGDSHSAHADPFDPELFNAQLGPMPRSRGRVPAGDSQQPRDAADEAPRD